LFASELSQLESEWGTDRPGRSSGRSRRSAAGGGEDRKTRQLCRQVYQALTLTLGGESGDDVLRDCTVESVVPAPNASRLLVRVALPPARPGEPAASPVAVMECLARAHGRLRRAVAAAVTRKRAPELTFLPVYAVAPDAPAEGAAGECGDDEDGKEVRP
jgi:ribosome-binding factor A